MDNDIDIEEHDVLENPMLRKLFPDLSTLKQEIIDYEDEASQEELNFQEKIVNNEVVFNSSINNNKITVSDGDEDMKFSYVKTQTALKRSCSSKTKIYCNNAVLDSQPVNYLPSQINILISNNIIKKSKVLLQNIEPYLMKSKRFCTICQILFPNKELLYYHTKLFHGNKYHSKSIIQNDNDLNTQFVRPCEQNSRNKKLISGVNVMVKINNPVTDVNKVDANQTSLKSCFHCNMLFPTQQLLIDHLYDILNEKKQMSRSTKNTTQTVENKCKQDKDQNFELKTSSNAVYKNELKVLALKTILYRCADCNLHFLTLESAKRHLHFSSIKYWKCKDCHRLFEENDSKVHTKQHECSNYFTVSNVYRNIRKEILYKCPKCTVHYCKENFTSHFPLCDFEQPQSSYCKLCDILIEKHIKTSHAYKHQINKMTSSDFNILDPDDFGFSQNKRRKMLKCKKTDKCSTKNNLLHLSYCNTCKCMLSRIYKNMIHRRSRCHHLIKYVCSSCGLIFSNTSIKIHRKLHRENKKLKLRDFTFYNLKTLKQIKPPIPRFPKCNSCEVHFILKLEVNRHICNKFRNDNYLMCTICKIKLSVAAYKLHMPFHQYFLESKESVDEVIAIDESEFNRNENNINSQSISDNKVIVIYTCKNCDLSLNAYDAAIEHCHSHSYNLDKKQTVLVKCEACNLSFDTLSYDKHKYIHENSMNDKYKFYSFDVFYFGTKNKTWLKYLFDKYDRHSIDRIIENAIYKYETRVKLTVTQRGQPDLILYKCERCECFVYCQSIYEHTKKCSCNYEKLYCTVCNLPFASTYYKKVHENTCRNINIDLYTIVSFNRDQDNLINQRIAYMNKYYVIYKCRNCYGVVTKKNNKFDHICVTSKCTKCLQCGLLINEDDYDIHTSRHKTLTSFNNNNMKVVLIGDENKNSTYKKDKSTFSGMVFDYIFYQCTNCEVCVRDFKSSLLHSCFLDIAKSKCPKCNLVFEEGKLFGHVKLHETDPDFSRETIMVKYFGLKKTKTEKNQMIADSLEIEYEKYNEKDTNISILNSNNVNVNKLRSQTNEISTYFNKYPKNQDKYFDPNKLRLETNMIIKNEPCENNINDEPKSELNEVLTGFCTNIRTPTPIDSNNPQKYMYFTVSNKDTDEINSNTNDSISFSNIGNLKDQLSKPDSKTNVKLKKSNEIKYSAFNQTDTEKKALCFENMYESNNKKCYDVTIVKINDLNEQPSTSDDNEKLTDLNKDDIIDISFISNETIADTTSNFNIGDINLQSNKLVCKINDKHTYLNNDHTVAKSSSLNKTNLEKNATFTNMYKENKEKSNNISTIDIGSLNLTSSKPVSKTMENPRVEKEIIGTEKDDDVDVLNVHLNKSISEINKKGKSFRWNVLVNDFCSYKDTQSEYSGDENSTKGNKTESVQKDSVQIDFRNETVNDNSKTETINNAINVNKNICEINVENEDDIPIIPTGFNNCDKFLTKTTDKPTKILKCSCGLHFLNMSVLEKHKIKCSKVKISKHNCSKCGLVFTLSELFKHLVEHHGDKNIPFKYEIVDLVN